MATPRDEPGEQPKPSRSPIKPSRARTRSPARPSRAQPKPSTRAKSEAPAKLDIGGNEQSKGVGFMEKEPAPRKKLAPVPIAQPEDQPIMKKSRKKPEQAPIAKPAPIAKATKTRVQKTTVTKRKAESVGPAPARAPSVPRPSQRSKVAVQIISKPEVPAIPEPVKRTRSASATKARSPSVPPARTRRKGVGVMVTTA